MTEATPRAMERIDVQAACRSIRDGMRHQRNEGNIPDSVFTIASDLLADIADASERDRDDIAMLQDLFVKWAQSRGYTVDSKANTAFLDQYAACYHAGFLPEVTP